MAQQVYSWSSDVYPVNKLLVKSMLCYRITLIMIINKMKIITAIQQIYSVKNKLYINKYSKK